MKVLNICNSPTDLKMDAFGMMKQLRTKMLALRSQFMDEEGKVKYLELKNSPAFEEYVQLATNLKNIDVGKMQDIFAHPK